MGRGQVTKNHRDWRWLELYYSRQFRPVLPVLPTVFALLLELEAIFNSVSYTGKHTLFKSKGCGDVSTGQT